MFAKVKKAKDPSSTEEAQGYALRLLEFRFRGEEELRQRLKEKEFTEATIQAVLEKLVDYRYVDDTRLLEGVIRQYKELGLYGPLYVKQKLLQRKFPREQIDTALKEFYSPEDELHTAKRFLTKQKGLGSFPREKGLGEAMKDQKAKTRLMQKLFRRGFSLGVVFKIIGQTNLDEEN